VEVWALWGCGVTPYVRHSTDCTCCDFGHLRFFNIILRAGEHAGGCVGERVGVIVIVIQESEALRAADNKR
jgi:hypothetical protein